MTCAQRLLSRLPDKGATARMIRRNLIVAMLRVGRLFRDALTAVGGMTPESMQGTLKIQPLRVLAGNS